MLQPSVGEAQYVKHKKAAGTESQQEKYKLEHYVLKR
jgi:hypothetical protein